VKQIWWSKRKGERFVVWNNYTC